MFLFDMKTSRKLCVDDDFQKPQKSKQSGNMVSNHVCVCVYGRVCVCVGECVCVRIQWLCCVESASFYVPPPTTIPFHLIATELFPGGLHNNNTPLAVKKGWLGLGGVKSTTRHEQSNHFKKG